MSSVKDTVCAVVVTYNRKGLLIECLEALCKQTRPVQGIYLIDNASTDGTPDLLLEKGYIKELPPENLLEPWEKEFEIKNLTDEQHIKFYYVRMHENTGGAGGFHEGVKRAYEKGYDWLWLMDDDVEPLPKALETQLSYAEISKCIHPSRKYVDGNRVLWEVYLDPKSSKEIFLKDRSFKEKKLNYCLVNVGCFEGMLIHRDIVARIGYPDKSFFISKDDTIYGFLASKFTKNIYIRDICFIKKVKKLNKLSGKSLYYFVRNRFILCLYLKREGYFTCKSYFWVFYKIFRMLVFNFVKLDLKSCYFILKGLSNGLKFVSKS
ncbi:glycosyltransferase family 2 protein [Thermosulfurimonas dismutans]|uniref:Rhamnosyl transferase n=1 Tax=Thermosulfurimonas dismutans TaxID=999894 RepID=A0A179D1H7_9BACT|nr:glycosyltransferase family 2 protein [Thermosulfurimonas dismutans]OAQ19843.1 rhamnosyl transferase [Thermosulfurimonas dismutans]